LPIEKLFARALRGVAITRKNFLVPWLQCRRRARRNPLHRAGSAKLNGLDTQAWLSDVIDRMANNRLINRLGELLPWNWQLNIATLAV
jgi:hypothetical protein